MTDTQTPAFAPRPSKHHWPEDFEHENGNYNCVCGICGTQFVGHKRRVQCKSCFVTAVVAERDQLKAALENIMRHRPDVKTRILAAKALEKNDG